MYKDELSLYKGIALPSIHSLGTPTFIFSPERKLRGTVGTYSEETEAPPGNLVTTASYAGRSRNMPFAPLRPALFVPSAPTLQMDTGNYQFAYEMFHLRSPLCSRAQSRYTAGRAPKRPVPAGLADTLLHRQ